MCNSIMAEMKLQKIGNGSAVKRIIPSIVLSALAAAVFIMTPGCSGKQSGGQDKTPQVTAATFNTATATAQVTAATFYTATATAQETKATPDMTTKIAEAAAPKNKINAGVSAAAHPMNPANPTNPVNPANPANPEASGLANKYQAPGATASTARTTSPQTTDATASSPKPNHLSAPQPVSQDLQVYSESLADKADTDILDTIRLTLDGNPIYFHKTGASVIFKDGRYYFDPDAFAGAITSAAPIYRGRLDNGYVSLYEICNAYDFRAQWDRKAKTINLFSGYSRPKPKDIPKGNNTGLLRLEDIAATGEDYSFDNELLCLRVIAEYLYSEGVIFSVAWTPRYVDPGKGYDNDLANVYSVYNAEFVFTMDYMIDRGAEIGLHGYTHQTGKQISLAGNEFSANANSTAKATRERIEAAIASAEKLKFPVDFFEFPHYSGTETQFKIAEEYFDVIYNHPYKKYPAKVYTVTKGERKVKYIHTTLDYMKSLDDADNMVNKIKNTGKTSLASLFYHDFYEHGFIKISVRDGKTLEIKYYDTSPLHRIVNAMHATGRSFASLHDF